MNGKKLKGKLEVIDLDYNVPGVPPAVKELKANAYKEGNTYFTWSGTSPRDTHYGFGRTVDEAVAGFQRRFDTKSEKKGEQYKPQDEPAMQTIISVNLKEKLRAHLPFF